MNEPRRKALDDIANKIYVLSWELDELRREEQEYFDNMPENLQCSERGERAEEAISSLEDAVDSLNSALESIGEAIG